MPREVFLSSFKIMLMYSSFSFTYIFTYIFLLLAETSSQVCVQARPYAESGWCCCGQLQDELGGQRFEQNLQRPKEGEEVFGKGEFNVLTVESRSFLTENDKYMNFIIYFNHGMKK